MKKFLNVVLVCLPLSVFWAVYFQKDTRWIEQGKQLDGRFGSWFTLRPEQLLSIGMYL